MRYEKEEHIILCNIPSKRLNLPCNTVYGFEQNEESYVHVPPLDDAALKYNQRKIRLFIC